MSSFQIGLLWLIALLLLGLAILLGLVAPTLPGASDPAVTGPLQRLAAVSLGAAVVVAIVAMVASFLRRRADRW
jgi:hypothetical protein